MRDPAIEVRDLRVARGGREVLGPLSFTASRGDLVLLRGDSGSGKSTLLHVLGGLVPHHDAAEVTGDARVAGLDLATSDLAAVSKRVALLMQDADDQFCAHDVETEVAFRLESRGVPRATLRRRVGRALSKWRLEVLREKPLDRLSGGERRRVLLAALDALEPHVVLLDEPLANLDARWRAQAVQDLATLRQRAAVVVAEHRDEDLRPWATRVVTIGQPIPARRLPPAPIPPGSPWPLRVADVSFGVLRRVSFLAAGGLIGVAGPNGAGKTTLARLLVGLERPDSGRVSLGSRDVTSIPARERARRVGFVVQRPADVLFAPRVRDEVEAGPRALGVRSPPRRAAEHLAFWGVDALTQRSPFTLSGGEAQRVALAACLAHDPPVAVLDEPTHGLDADGRRRLRAWLAARRGRGLTFLLTHDQELLDLCERRLRLENGILVADDAVGSRTAASRPRVEVAA